MNKEGKASNKPTDWDLITIPEAPIKNAISNKSDILTAAAQKLWASVAPWDRKSYFWMLETLTTCRSLKKKKKKKKELEPLTANPC